MTEPMFSLENAFSYDEIREFDRRIKKLLSSDEEIEYTVEPKYGARYGINLPERSSP